MPKKRHKTEAAFSEPHKIVKFVAPFTVLLDNNARWHLSKLKSCPAPHEDTLDIPLASDVVEEELAYPAVEEAVSDSASSIPPRRSTRLRTVPQWQKDFHLY